MIQNKTTCNVLSKIFSFQDKQDLKYLYECPVYTTRQRGKEKHKLFMSEKSYVNSLFVIVSGPTYIWTFNLKTKEKTAKWVLAGVALLLQI